VVAGGAETGDRVGSRGLDVKWDKSVGGEGLDRAKGQWGS